jgi:molybdopterin adenylyltransferase
VSAGAQPVRVCILTVSDSVAAGRVEDRSGARVAERCRELGWAVESSAVRADDRPAIEEFLKSVADAHSADILLTTGGTGLGPRDVTPEATEAVVERLIPGFPERMRAAGAQKAPRSWLSRAAAGIRGNTIIINLPGSPTGAVESLDTIADLLPHAIAVLHGARHD